MGQYVKELYDASGKISKAMIRWLLKNTTACILLGENTKSVYNGFIDSKRLFSVPGSVEDSRENLDNETEMKAQDGINVLYFSFMSQSKGVMTAFKAASKVLNDNQKVQFTFAGPMESGEIKEGFDQLRAQFNSRVKHLGYIGDISQRAKKC